MAVEDGSPLPAFAESVVGRIGSWRRSSWTISPGSRGSRRPRTGREVAYFARVDAAEAFASFIEMMADELADEPVDEWTVAACDTARHDAPYDHDPEPPTPAAPNVVPFPGRKPFDIAAHCQAIAAGGGQRTVERYGSQHMRAIGKAGARATIKAHGLDTFKGIVKAKGWAGPRTPDLAADLALGADLADAA